MKYLLITLGLITCLTTLSCQRKISDRGSDQGISFELEGEAVHHISPSLGGLRSIGSVGSVANDQGPLVDGDITFASSAYFPLNGDSLNDASLGGNLTETGSPTYSGNGIFGEGGIVYIDNANLLTSNNVYFNPANVDFSVAGWFKPDTWTNGTDQTLFAQEFSAVSRSWKLSMSYGKVINMTTSIDGSTTVNSSYTHSFNDEDKFRHFAMTHEVGGTLKVYIDGQLVITHSAGGAIVASGTNDFGVGVQRNGSTSPFFGYVQEVMFTQSLLTDSQINAIYSKRFTNTPQIAAGHKLTNDSFNKSLTGLTSYWTFDGDGLDGSGNAKPAVAQNGAVFTGGGIFGSDNSLYLDGSGASVDIADDNQFDFTENLAFGGWFFIQPTGANRALIDKWGSAGNRSYLMQVESDDDLALYFSADGTANTVVNYNMDGYINKWVHIAVVYNPNDYIHVYINGDQVSSGASVGSLFASTESITLGASSSAGGDNYLGRMSNIFLSDKMSAKEIKYLYSSKINHQGNYSPVYSQRWQATYQSEDSFTTLPLENGWLVNMKENDLYMDFSSMSAGQTVYINQR